MAKRLALVVVVSLLAAACHPAPEPQSPAKGRVRLRDDMKLTDSGSKEDHEEGEDGHGVTPPSKATKKGAFKLPADGENFVGTDRAVAKTTAAKAPARKLTLSALLDEFKPGRPKSDDQMRHHHKPLMCKESDCDRVDEENDNVQVEAWVVAASKESDGDFHLILAATELAAASLRPSRWELMNAEVSGLPPAGTAGRPALEHARKQFRAGFVPPVKESSGYVALEPVHVRITGSLFYDIDHPAGAVGPGPLKPQTSWEIHPVTDLEILE